MDYAERGAIEKTFDTVLDDGANGLDTASGISVHDLIDGAESLSDSGQIYTTGILIGMLTTIRTFADEPTEFNNDDAEELTRIVRRREAEMAQRLAGQDRAD